MNIARPIADFFGYDLVRKRKNPDTLRKHLSALLAKLNIELVLDVGANTGQYATGLRHAGYKGHILSFEPAPEPFATLEKTSQPDPLWQVVQAALGETRGDQKLNLTRGSELNSFLPPNTFALKMGNGMAGEWEVTGTRMVPVHTVDGILAEWESRRVFLKMDTQGFDLEVFGGARDSIDRILGLQSEISVIATYEGMPDYLEALRVFRGLGFVPTGFYPVWRRNTLEVVEFDCIMRRGVA